MSEQKKQLLKSLAEATERMNEDALEKVVTFTAGVSAGAACAKPIEPKEEDVKQERKEEDNEQRRLENQTESKI